MSQFDIIESASGPGVSMCSLSVNEDCNENNLNDDIEIPSDAEI